MLFDVHTHHLPPAGSVAVFSLCMRDGVPPAGACCLSAGIHPWYLTAEDLDAQVEWLSAMARYRGVVAIGEAGIDRCCPTPPELQMRAFRACAGLSESMGMPLIIHCVRAVQEVLAVRKELSPSQPWIMHGFRGKPELASSLLRHGFHLSFGLRLNEETVRRMPVDRLFLETDESASGIEAVYSKAASVRGVSVRELESHISDNAARVFGIHL